MDEKRSERIKRGAEFLGTVVTEHHELHEDNIKRAADALAERREQIVRDAESVRELLVERRAAEPGAGETAPDPDAAALAEARRLALQSAGLSEAGTEFTRCEWTDFQGERLVHLEYAADGMSYECYADPLTGQVEGFLESPADT